MFNNRKMKDNDEIAASDETFEEIDECSIKIEQQIEQNEEETPTKYLDFTMEVNEFLETENSKLRRSKRFNKLPDTKLQSQMFTLQSYSSVMAEQHLGSKYRPIRPKPYTVSDKPHQIPKKKLLGISAALNMSGPNPSNRFIVASVSSKDKKQDVTILNSASSNETSNYIRSINGKIGGTTMMKKGTNGDRNGTGNPNVITVGTDRRKAKIPNQSIKRHSIELFFDSMVQTVLKLPGHIQAEIKMEICKLVTKAEINHYESQLR